MPQHAPLDADIVPPPPIEGIHIDEAFVLSRSKCAQRQRECRRGKLQSAIAGFAVPLATDEESVQRFVHAAHERLDDVVSLPNGANSQ